MSGSDTRQAGHITVKAVSIYRGSRNYLSMKPNKQSRLDRGPASISSDENHSAQAEAAILLPFSLAVLGNFAACYLLHVFSFCRRLARLSCVKRRN